MMLNVVADLRNVGSKRMPSNTVLTTFMVIVDSLSSATVNSN